MHTQTFTDATQEDAGTWAGSKQRVVLLMRLLFVRSLSECISAWYSSATIKRVFNGWKQS